MKIFIKQNIMPLIGLALTLFGLVMIIIAKDWVNIVWPVIVLFLIFKGFKTTHNTMELQSSYAHAEEQLNEVRKNRDDYMHAYKEYRDKYEAKASECDDLAQQLKNSAQQTAGTKEVSVLGTAAQKPVRKRQAKSKKSVAEIKADIKDVSSNLEKK